MLKGVKGQIINYVYYIKIMNYIILNAYQF